MNDEGRLIGIQQVATIFGKSVESIRKYKNYGILKVADKVGNKDLFDREDVIAKKEIIRSLRVSQGLSLSQIAEQIEELTQSGTVSTSVGIAEPLLEPGPPKILVVEDEQEIRDSLADFLRDFYEVVGAADGQEALDKTLTEKPDLILLDLRLPKIDGYRVCEWLKSNPTTAHIPIIMVTALVATPQKVRGIEYGADDYITKPFDLDEVAARIKMVLRRVRRA